MALLFVAAEAAELKPFANLLTGLRKLKWPMAYAYEGILDGRRILLAANGAGPKLAAHVVEVAVRAAMVAELSSSRLEAVITTAAMDEAARGAWCRSNGVYPQQLAQWRVAATAALAEPQEASGATQQTKQDRRRIKELERELQRKEKALAEAAALLVLSKKVEAIFNKGEAE